MAGNSQLPAWGPAPRRGLASSRDGSVRGNGPPEWRKQRRQEPNPSINEVTGADSYSGRDGSFSGREARRRPGAGNVASPFDAALAAADSYRSPPVRADRNRRPCDGKPNVW